MRKILLTLFLSLSLFLVACNKAKPLEVLDVTVVSETYLYDTLNVGVVITLADLEETELIEISNSIASQIYMKYANDIKNTKATLTINLYDSEASFSAKTTTYGVMTYVINLSVDKPGLANGNYQK